MLNWEDVEKTPVKEVQIPQGTDPWLEYRGTGRDGKPFITGTGIAAITPHPKKKGIYCSKFETNTPQKLADLLDGKTKISVPKEILQHGNNYEQEARNALTKKTKKIYTPAVYERWYWLASLDGETDDQKTVCEIKCPWSQKRGHTWKEASKGNIETQYLCQMALQFLVAPKVEQIDFFVYASESKEGILIECQKEHFEDLFEPMVKATEEFVKQYDSGAFSIPVIEDEATQAFVNDWRKLKTLKEEVKRLEEMFKTQREVLWNRHGAFYCDSVKFSASPKAPSVSYVDILEVIKLEDPKMEARIEELKLEQQQSKESGYNFKLEEFTF